MTAEKIINRINELELCGGTNILYSELTTEAFKSAVELLKKHIPQQWIKEDHGHVEYTAVCPECMYGIPWSDAEYYEYCPICGQRLTMEENQ